jgi:hypothetical protein
MSDSSQHAVEHEVDGSRAAQLCIAAGDRTSTTQSVVDYLYSRMPSRPSGRFVVGTIAMTLKFKVSS